MQQFKFDFLSFDDEKKIKKEYENEKKLGNIDTDIIPILDKLNSIDGLATLYSCMGHSHKPKSYIVIKFKESLSSKIIKIIEDLLIETPNMRVDWEHSINCGTTDNEKEYKATVLRGDLNCEYMYLFFNKLNNSI